MAASEAESQGGEAAAPPEAPPAKRSAHFEDQLGKPLIEDEDIRQDPSDQPSASSAVAQAKNNRSTVISDHKAKMSRMSMTNAKTTLNSEGPANLVDIHTSVRAKTQILYEKMMISIGVFFYAQDKILDLALAYELFEKANLSWAVAIMVCILAPNVLLCLANLQRRSFKHALYALLFLSFYFEAYTAFTLGEQTWSFKRENDVHMLFESLPQFMIQSQLILIQHFGARDCEAAFDRACMQQCTNLPETYPDDMTRFSCISEFKNAECWKWYERCIEDCPAFELLLAKDKAETAYQDAIWKLKSFNPYVWSWKSQARSETTKDFSNAMDEDSPEWRLSLCGGEASSLGNLTNPYTGNPLRTMQRSVMLMYMQVPSLVTSGMAIACTRAFRTLEDRSAPDTTIVTWATHALSFFLHFLFDIWATCGAISLFYASSKQEPILRVTIALGILLLFQVLIRRQPCYKRSTFLTRTAAGIMYILLSPLSRLPATKDLPAKTIRLLLRFRSAVQIGLATFGFTRLAHESERGIAAWYKELFASVVLIFNATLFTHMPGTRDIWTAKWDKNTQRLMMVKELRNFDLRKAGKMFAHWQIYMESERVMRENAAHLANRLSGDVQDWSSLAHVSPDERRTEMETDEPVTFNELMERWKDTKSLAEVYIYWEIECVPIELEDGGTDLISWITTGEPEDARHCLHHYHHHKHEHDDPEPSQEPEGQPEKSDTAEPEKSDAAEPEKSDAAEPEKSDAAEQEKSDAAEPEKSDAAAPEKSDAASTDTVI